MSKLKNYKMYIDGEWIDSESKKTFETLNPENNEPWATVPEASAKDVDKAVKAAQKAFEGKWSNLFPKERANYLKWLAPRVSSLFTEKQKIDVKQDTTLNIKWESEPDMIDVSGDITDIPPDNKD